MAYCTYNRSKGGRDVWMFEKNDRDYKRDAQTNPKLET